MNQVRKSQGWFSRVKWLGSAAIWLVIIGFIAHWIYEYDVCKAESTDPNPQLGCLVMSLFGTYFTWLIAAVAWFLKLVTVAL